MDDGRSRGAACRDYDRHLGSAENTLVQCLPFLRILRDEHERSRAAGMLLHGSGLTVGRMALDQAPGAGPSLSGDRGIAALAGRVRAAVERALALWEANADADGHCPPVDGFADCAAPLEDPLCARWGEGGAEAAAFKRKLHEMWRAAADERMAEAKEASRGAIRVGRNVTLCALGGHPEEIVRVAGGSPGTGYELADGRRLVFAETSPFGGWTVVEDGRRTGLEARPSHPLDAKAIALEAGLLGDDGRRLRASALPLPKADHVARCANRHRLARGLDLTGASDLFRMEPMLRDLLPDGDGWRLMAYMHRRFGPASVSTDTYKSMCGAWLVSTPLTDLFLLVEPHPLGLEHSFGAYLARDKAWELRGLQREYNEERHQGGGTARGEAWLAAMAPYTRALRGAFRDLLRPVMVRDVALNALGAVEDDEPLMAWDEREAEGPDGGMRHGVAYDPASTVGLPGGFLGDLDALQGLLGALRGLDGDDWGRAMRLAAERLAEPDQVADPEDGPAAAAGRRPLR